MAYCDTKERGLTKYNHHIHQCSNINADRIQHRVRFIQ